MVCRSMQYLPHVRPLRIRWPDRVVAVRQSNSPSIRRSTITCVSPASREHDAAGDRSNRQRTERRQTLAKPRWHYNPTTLRLVPFSSAAADRPTTIAAPNPSLTLCIIKTLPLTLISKTWRQPSAKSLIPKDRTRRGANELPSQVRAANSQELRANSQQRTANGHQRTAPNQSPQLTATQTVCFTRCNRGWLIAVAWERGNIPGRETEVTK